MVKNPPEGMQRVVPYIFYADAVAALEFLVRAFGFTERMRFPMSDGKIGHAELLHHDCAIALASVYEEMGCMSPRDLPGSPGQIQCYVDDVDAHYARAKAEGATIVAEPEDQFYGDRSYRAADLEGHRWDCNL